MTRNKGPDIMFTYMEALWLSFVFGHLSTVECSLTGVVATCKANPAIEGKTGVMNISFSPDIDFTRDHLFVYLSKTGGLDILHCGKINKPPPAECKILKADDDGFTTEGRSGHNLILLVTRATPDLQGEYVLGGYVNKSPVSRSSCNFTVSTMAAVPDDDNTKRVVTIVVPILVTAFIIVIAVIVFVLFKRRKRERQNLPRRRYEHTAEGEPLAGASPS